MSGKLKDQILSANDRRLEPLEMPGWGCTVYLKALSASAAETMAGMSTSNKDSLAKLAVLVIANEEGDLVFDQGDVKALGERSLDSLKRLTDAALKMNGLTKEAVEEARKN